MKLWGKNQDGSVGGHSDLLAQPELTENRTARGSNTKEIQNKHSSRLVGGAEMAAGAEEDSRGCGWTETGGVWDEPGRQSGH